MSWFKRDSPLRNSFTRRRSSLSPPPPKLDDAACLEVFKMHWQQAWCIMQKNGSSAGALPPTSDDVTGVVNHMDQMVNLLLQEIGSVQQGQSCNNQEIYLNSVECPDTYKNTESIGPIFNYMLLEGVLHKLYTWSIESGEFVNVMKMELLRIYEVLVSHCRQNILFNNPVVCPLLKLLATCVDCAPVDVEKRLIVLLNTLCVCLSQYPDLLQVFFNASSDQGPARFLIFSLLIPFVHREGAIGQQARDSLLLCMALSRRNESIGLYIAEHSNFCPVIATGLSGLYSVLPRKLALVSEDWYHFTPEDIQELPDLAMFLNSLEFCNAVIQVSHPLVQEQLLEYLYQGFLVPVLGPALHQDTLGVPIDRLESTTKYLVMNLLEYHPFDPFVMKKAGNYGNVQSSVEEIIATTAYLELFLRTITEQTLLQVFLKFILTATYDGQYLLNALVERIGAQSRLCMVTMALFRTLLDINCEDVMFELVLKYLIPCSHIMVSQRSRVRDTDLYSCTADKFLSLIPICCVPNISNEHSSQTSSPSNNTGPYPVGLKELCNSITGDRRAHGGSLRLKRHARSPSTTSFAFGDFDVIHSRLFGTENSMSPQVKLEQFQTSYLDYLKAAHHNIKSCTFACKCWSFPYDGLNPPPDVWKATLPKQESQMSLDNDTVISNSLSSSSVSKSNVYVEDVHKEVPQFRRPKRTLSCERNVLDCSSLQTNRNNDSCAENLSVPTANKCLQDAKETLSNGVMLNSSSTVINEKVLSYNIESDTVCSASQENCIDIANELVGIDDDQMFWSVLNSTKTPSSVSDLEDSLEAYDSCLSCKEGKSEINSNCNPFSTSNIITSYIHVKEESSTSDSGVYESRESNSSSSDKDVDLLHVSVKGAKGKNAAFPEEAVHQGSESISRLDLKLSQHTFLSGKNEKKVIPGSWESFGSPDIGPFLSILLTRLEMMMHNDVYTNLQLTGLVTRLAWFPQPLLRSFLLNHTLVFQPTIRSLLQVLGSLKHKIESYSYTVDNFEQELIKSRQFLSAREERLLGNGPPRVYGESTATKRRGSQPDLHRGESRRLSFTNFLFRRSSIFEDKVPSSAKEPVLETIPDGHGYRYITKTSCAAKDKLDSVEKKNAVLCAVVLEEFLKELAAITQEHTIIQLDPDFWDVRWQL